MSVWLTVANFPVLFTKMKNLCYFKGNHGSSYDTSIGWLQEADSRVIYINNKFSFVKKLECSSLAI